MLPRFAFLAIAAGLAGPSLASGFSDTTIQPQQDREIQLVPAGLDLHPERQGAADRLEMFTPTSDPIRHRIDYDIWDYALQKTVLSMGPSTRSVAYSPIQPVGTRVRQGHKSQYRLEGSMVAFSFFDRRAIESFTILREDLQSIGERIPIHTLPRDEQLAYWINLHNVAMMEQIAQRWPLRQPREIMLDGIPLDDARFIRVQGVDLSLRDIRENIVFAHWRSPKVIYGFWRGEIGGPALQPAAFTGRNVGSLLDIAAAEFINSLRGTEKRGDTLHVSKLYDEAARFYFPDFATDLRAHIAEYAEDEVAEILGKTTLTRASIREHDIADLSGGSRGANYLNGSVSRSRPGIAPGVVDLLRQRNRKLEVMQRRNQPTGRVFFSNIELPGDPPNKNAVE